MLGLIGLIFLAVGAHGLYTGSVIAGSRGFKSNSYSREDNPVLFCLFVAMYLAVGFVAIFMGVGMALARA